MGLIGDLCSATVATDLALRLASEPACWQWADVSAVMPLCIHQHMQTHCTK